MFESEGERLAWLVSEVEARVSRASLEPPDPKDLEVFRVTASWLARCLDLVKGLAVLVQEELYAPACVLSRTAWEIWIDWRYLLRIGDRRLNAAKVLLRAQIETLEFANRHSDIFESTYLARLRQSLHDFESGHSEASAALKKQRSSRHFHWSGLTYSQMERAVGGEHGVYGPLSWETHGTVTAIRDVELEVESNTATFRFGQTEKAHSPDFILSSSGGVLFYVYNEFAHTWGLQPLELPQKA